MQKWLVAPRDPLIFRNGKPFSAAPGSRAETLPIPYPSTLAGAVRTRAGIDPGTGQFQKSLIESLLKNKVYAPILVEIDKNNQVIDYFLPAPSDALLMKANIPEKATCYDLKPIKMPDAQVDLRDLRICGPERIIKEKPHPEAPGYWRWGKYLEWLLAPKAQDTITLSDIGIDKLIQEYRTHVKMEDKSQVAEEGALFQTSGLEFVSLDRKDDEPYLLSNHRRLGLLVLTDATISEGTGYLGGERRTVSWFEINNSTMVFETCPESLRKRILDDGYCRLILITPAYFMNGNLPHWLQTTFGVNVKAAINSRYSGVSGWDYEKKSPKPSKRLTPAGSIYFLKLPDGEKEREAFIKGAWMEPISDDEQMRWDGFGMALLGVWDGIDREMKKEAK